MFSLSLGDLYFEAITNLDSDYQSADLAFIADLMRIQSTSEEYLTEPGDDDKYLKQMVKDVKSAKGTLMSACTSQSIQKQINNIVNCAPIVFEGFQVQKLGDKQCNLN